MSAPITSVVMSVYNGGRYLRESVESILSQEFADFEFLIVNDGSKDESPDILAEYARQDMRIRILDQENRGLTRALVRGCSEARGCYIARQDADDWSHPRRLRRSVEVLDRSPQLAMVGSWARYIDAVGDEVESVERPADPQVATHQLLHQRLGPPAHGSVMFRRSAYEAVGGYRACFYYAQDSDLWQRLASAGQVAYVQEYLYHYRLTPEAISGAQTPVQWQFGELGQRCNAARLRGESEEPFLRQAEALRTLVLEGKVTTSGVRRRRAAANYRIGTGLSRRGNPRARQYFWTAIRLNPLHWRSWCRLCAEFVRPPRQDVTPPDLITEGNK
ncbi:MAG: glycosyltransferase family A protein [Thermoguttaceae bacterium]